MVLKRTWELFTEASSLDTAIKTGLTVRAAFIHFCRVIEKTRLDWTEMLRECIFLKIHFLKEAVDILGYACI